MSGCFSETRCKCDSWFLGVEFADKKVYDVLEQWLLQQRETEASEPVLFLSL